MMTCMEKRCGDISGASDRTPRFPSRGSAAPSAQAAAAAGVPVVLDAGGAEGPLPAELLRCVTVLSPNETELARAAQPRPRPRSPSICLLGPLHAEQEVSLPKEIA